MGAGGPECIGALAVGDCATMTVSPIRPGDAAYLRALGHSERQIDRMSINTRMYHDLGVYGDSAIEDMQVLAEKFGVNLSNFDFDRYFPPQFEGRNRFEMVLINSLPFVSKIVRDRREYLPVTLAMIDQSLREKTWPADDLTQV